MSYGEIQKKKWGSPQVFIDLENAYDSVPREAIWRILESRSILKGYIIDFHDMYCRSTTCVWTPFKDKVFQLRSGYTKVSSQAVYPRLDLRQVVS